MASSAQVNESLNMLFAPPPPPAVPSSSQREQPSASQAQRPLPSAPSLPPSSAARDSGPSQASTSTEPLFQWPGNHRGPPIRLFFDPESSKAARTRAELDAELFKNGDFLPVVSKPAKATHICLDADNEDNHWLRDCRPDQHVVSLEWVEDSFMEQKSADERNYQLTDTNARGGPSQPSMAQLMEVDSMHSEGGTTRQGADNDDDPDFDQLQGDDTSGSDEEFERHSEHEQSGAEDFTEEPNNGYNFLAAAWTAMDQNELAGMLSERTGSFSSVYRLFHDRHPERSASAVSAQHHNKRPWYDQTVRRLQRKAAKRQQAERSDASDRPLGSQRPGPSRSGSSTSLAHQPSRDEFDAPPKKPNPFSRPATASSQPTGPSSSSNPTSSSSRAEPDSFLLPGSRPRSHLSRPDAKYCFFCGYGGTDKTYSTCRNLVGSRGVDPATGQTVYEYVSPRFGCSSCYSFLNQGVKRDEAYVWTRAMPREVGEMERLAWVTEKLLVRGMKRRKEVVDAGRER